LDQLAAKIFQHRRHLSLELGVAVEDEILGCTALWEGLSQLLHDPGTGGMFVTLSCRRLRRPWLVTKKQYSTRKVAVGTVKKSRAAMVLEKGQPALTGVSRRVP
jgi:hypothetical protein